ncbi:hypothetical protein [Acidovorax sp.]|uniref:hypothetical protein n=1 Tax=Acidovorax sp. TaxID=1872122 RepID=UPI00391F37B3
MSNPSIATQASPGGGKSRFLFTLACLSFSLLKRMADESAIKEHCPFFFQVQVPKTIQNLEKTIGITISHDHHQTIFRGESDPDLLFFHLGCRALHSFVTSFFSSTVLNPN